MRRVVRVEMVAGTVVILSPVHCLLFRDVDTAVRALYHAPEFFRACRRRAWRAPESLDDCDDDGQGDEYRDKTHTLLRVSGWFLPAILP